MDSVSYSVRRILHEVRKRGDKALCLYARRYDRMAIAPNKLRVSSAATKEALQRVTPAFLKALKECARQIERFAIAEKRRLTVSWMDVNGSVRVGQRIQPVDSVGLYIPGGRYPSPSTVLMSVIPAKVAGVRRIVAVTPPKNLTPEVLAAMAIAEPHEVYRIGGAGAIGALAYGTRTIRGVDFIAGPGNQFVTEAKRQVYGQVGIDSLAGPSEVVIVADGRTPLRYLVHDLQAQAEHDPDARAVLLCTDRALIGKVRRHISAALSRRVETRVVPSVRAALVIANTLAPEHLELLIPDAERYLPAIRHAGAIFLGPASPAALGDYAAGPSHVLPTHRSARFSSGLSVATFMTRSSVISFHGVSGERPQWEASLVMAQAEGMDQHAESLRQRMAT